MTERQSCFIGSDLYYERWWMARMRGIVLRPWDELSPAIRAVWNERAASREVEQCPASSTPKQPATPS